MNEKLEEVMTRPADHEYINFRNIFHSKEWLAESTIRRKRIILCQEDDNKTPKNYYEKIKNDDMCLVVFFLSREYLNFVIPIH